MRASAVKFLADVKQHYTTALFSNSNVVHWERKINEMQLGALFDHHFASHLMGCAKPSPESYEKLLAGLSVPASQVLFFDDNQMNVDAAKTAGIHAISVVGFQALQEVLTELRLYPLTTHIAETE